MSRTLMKASGLAGALLLSLAACSLNGSGLDSWASDSRSSPSPGVETSSRPTQTSPSSDLNGYDVSISWNFPESIDGYTVNVHDRDLGGVFGASKDNNGCRTYTYQDAIPGATGTERELSEEFWDGDLEAMVRQGDTDLSYEESSDNYVKSEDGTEVEGVALDIAYTDSDGVRYRGWHWYRHFDDDVMPVSLLAAYSCPEGEYSPEEVERLFSEDLHIEGLSAGDEKMSG